MIVSIRSTNGGGKSTIVRGLMSQVVTKSPIFGLLGVRKPEAYALGLNGVKGLVFVLGPYHIDSGGCDSIQPYDLILELLEKYSLRGHVVFEGVIVSSSYGRVGRFMEACGKEAVMAFLTTPLEVCIERVKKRRELKGDVRLFNPQNLTSKFNQIVGSKAKMISEGKLRVVDLDYKNALPQLLELLRSAK